MRRILCNKGSGNITVSAKAPRLMATLAIAAIVCGQPLMTVAAPVTENQNTEGRAKIGLVVAVELDQEDSGVETFIYDAVVASLDDVNLEIESDEVGSLLTIEVRWVEGTLTDYAVTFRLGPTNSAAPKTIHVLECTGCTASQLLTRVGQAVEAVVPPALVTESPTPEPVAEQPDEPRMTPPPVLVSQPQPLRDDEPMLLAGILTLGAGFAGMAGVTAGVVAMDAADIPRRGYEWPLFAAAGGVAVIGASLIGGAVAIGRKQRARAGKQEARARLLPGPGGLGLSVRF